MLLNKFESKVFGRICYGYIRRKDGLIETNEEKAKVVRCVFQLYLSGNSLQEIQDILEKKKVLSPSGNKQWTRDVISKVLTNGKYFDKIIPMFDFIEVQRLLDQNCRYHRY